MARKYRRRQRNYKKTNILTKPFGSAGEQVRIATFSKSDAQMPGTYLNNVNVSAMLQEGDGDAGGMLFYLSTEAATWDDDKVISAKGIPGYGGSCSLAAKRKITINAEKELGDFGQVYLWGEITDLSYTSEVEVRVVIETWGRNVLVTEDAT